MKVACTAPPLSRTGSTCVPSCSEVFVIRKTPFSSSGYMDVACTLAFAMTFKSSAAAEPARQARTVPIVISLILFIDFYQSLPSVSVGIGLEVEAGADDQHVGGRLQSVRIVSCVKAARGISIAVAVDKVPFHLYVPPVGHVVADGHSLVVNVVCGGVG